jgi:hypothetical protein
VGICVKHERASLTGGGGDTTTNADGDFVSDCNISDTDVAGGATPFGFADGEHISCTSLILSYKVMGASDVEASSEGQRNWCFADNDRVCHDADDQQEDSREWGSREHGSSWHRRVEFKEAAVNRN